MTDQHGIDSKAVTAFRRDGFVAIRQFLKGNELDQLHANLDRFLTNVVQQLARDQVFYEDKSDESSLKQIQHMDQHDAWFGDLFRGSRFRGAAEQLLCGGVVPKNLQFFRKAAGIGRATPPHQDGYYFMLDPCEAVTMWLALDYIDEENGCVRYVSGSHRCGLRPHSRTTTLGFSQGISDYPTPSDLENEQPIVAEPGDLLIHDALTIHRADANRSPDRDRRALGFVYFGERAKEDKKAQAAYQRRLAADMIEQGKI